MLQRIVEIMKKITQRRELTSIQVSVETRERLKKAGKKGETYEEIVTRLIRECEEKHEP